MGFKDDVREKAIELDQRVTALERQVANLRRGNGAVTVETPLPVRTPGASLGVDYGAVAFGLSEIKREVAQALNTTGVSAQTLTSKFEGTVQYFADVFAKSDPGFNEAEFKRQAGV